MFYVQNISKYVNFRGGVWPVWEDVHIPPHIFFIIKKTKKVQEHDLYLNPILHHFDF